MSSSSDERGPINLLADEFLARCKRGERPTIQEYCDRHPELAGEIRDVFEAVLMVEDLKPGPDDVSGSVGESVKVDGKRLAQVGDYRILCEIGRGGMGVVYEAEQQALGRRVALKVLPRISAGNGSAQVRFQREAKAAARIAPPARRRDTAQGVARPRVSRGKKSDDAAALRGGGRETRGLGGVRVRTGRRDC